MEPISKRSRIVKADQTEAINIASSQLSFSGFYERDVYNSTPPDANTRTFNFTILPTTSSELHPKTCDLIVKWRLLQADGSRIPNEAQVGCIQGFAATAWSRCCLKIGGQIYKSEFPLCDHAVFMRYMTSHTKEERKSLLHSIGHREDAIGRSDANKPDLDPKCTCSCKKCLCAIKVMPSTQGSANCDGMTYAKLIALEDKTEAQIKSDADERKEFNPGKVLKLHCEA